MTKLIEKNSTVSKLYEEKTGKKWSTAKAEGLTSGSYEDNMKLKHRLLSGEFDLEKDKFSEIAKKITKIESSYDPGPVGENLDKYLIPTKNKEYDARSFKDAFIKARKELGAGKVFIYNGKRYTTNYAEENSNNIVSDQNNKSNKLISKTNKTIDKSTDQNNKSIGQNNKSIGQNNKSIGQNNKSIGQNKSPQFQYDWQTEVRPSETILKDLRYLSSLQNENEINAYIQNKKLISNQHNRYDEDGNLIYDENGMKYRSSGAIQATGHPLEVPVGIGGRVTGIIWKQAPKLLPQTTQKTLNTASKLLPNVASKLLPKAAPKLLPQTTQKTLNAAPKLLFLNP